MEQKKKTSDELTPEDKEAFRFYFGQILASKELPANPQYWKIFIENASEVAFRAIKEEKRRLNVS